MSLIWSFITCQRSGPIHFMYSVFRFKAWIAGSLFFGKRSLWFTLIWIQILGIQTEVIKLKMRYGIFKLFNESWICGRQARIGTSYHKWVFQSKVDCSIIHLTSFSTSSEQNWSGQNLSKLQISYEHSLGNDVYFTQVWLQVFYLCKPTPQYPKVEKRFLKKSTNLTSSFICATHLGQIQICKIPEILSNPITKVNSEIPQLHRWPNMGLGCYRIILLTKQ